LLSQVLSIARAEEALVAAEDAVRVSDTARAGSGSGRGSLGVALLNEGRLDEADEQLGLALAGAKAGTRPHLLATRYRAALLRMRGQSAKALPLLDQVIREATPDPFDHPELAAAYVERGLALVELEKLDAAQEAFASATAALDRLHGTRMTPLRADLLIGQARLHLRSGDEAAALPPLERAHAYWQERRPDSRWAAEAARWLNQAQALQGKKRASP
jgi:tetratricopeptide (TPR) repeat protein